MKKLLGPLVVAGAALVAFFFDPVSGRRRRAQTVQRTGGFFRRRARETGQLGRAAGAEASRVAQKLAHAGEAAPKEELNDPAIARKVESEIFRDSDVPKGQINVAVRNGVVELRGEVAQPDLIEELVAKARSVPEVKDVENLLHLPGTEAPMHQ